MLYSSLMQPSAFFNLSICGFLAGTLYIIFAKIVKIIVKMRFFYHFFNFFIYLFVFFCFLLSNLIFNFGEYRAFSFLAFFLSFLISDFFLSKILGSFWLKCYNKTKVKFDEKFRHAKKV